jgi:pimeloyl-ACP methyl ester carboxylesterase
MPGLTALATERAARSRAGSIERLVDVDGCRVRYIESGVEHVGPPLVMLHGYQVGADLWFPRGIPALASEHHVIAPDLPGFGGSGKLDEYSVASYGAFIHRFLDALHLERVNLLGHSMGAQVAVGAVAHDPGRFRRLVLVDAAGLPRPGPRWIVPLKMLTDPSVLHFRLYPTFFRLGVQSNARREALAMIQNDSVEGLLSNIMVPTLVLWGSRDRITPIEHGVYMAKHLPNARLGIIRGSGHAPFYQKPRQFNRAVLGFLARET